MRQRGCKGQAHRLRECSVSPAKVTPPHESPEAPTVQVEQMTLVLQSLLLGNKRKTFGHQQAERPGRLQSVRAALASSARSLLRGRCRERGVRPRRGLKEGPAPGLGAQPQGHTGARGPHARRPGRGRGPGGLRLRRPRAPTGRSPRRRPGLGLKLFRPPKAAGSCRAPRRVPALALGGGVAGTPARAQGAGRAAGVFPGGRTCEPRGKPAQARGLGRAERAGAPLSARACPQGASSRGGARWRCYWCFARAARRPNVRERRAYIGGPLLGQQRHPLPPTGTNGRSPPLPRERAQPAPRPPPWTAGPPGVLAGVSVAPQSLPPVQEAQDREAVRMEPILGVQLSGSQAVAEEGPSPSPRPPAVRFRGPPCPRVGGRLPCRCSLLSRTRPRRPPQAPRPWPGCPWPLQRRPAGLSPGFPSRPCCADSPWGRCSHCAPVFRRC
nr:basic salivary proline-rich protein 2-like [Desmodus rotundus]